MKMIDSSFASAPLTSQNSAQETLNSGANPQKHIMLYQKCLDCPDYGVSCNGPKLAALGDLMTVRGFHRDIRNKREIPMKMIYLAAPSISESTINDYFSHSVKDFKWTTVGCIDNALTAICGNRIGQPLLDHPCPASSTDIQEQINRHTREMDTLAEENRQLQLKVTETKGKVIAVREEVREDYASRVQFLRDLCEKRQADVDNLNRQLEEQMVTHQKEVARMDRVAADYLARIDEKNKRIDMLNRANHLMVFFLICTLLALTCYLVWDLMHPLVGLFQW